MKTQLRHFGLALAVALVVFAGLKITVALTAPTAEEIIQQTIVFNGSEWDKWNETEQSALETIERCQEAKNALHEQTESLRAFF